MDSDIITMITPLDKTVPKDMIILTTKGTTTAATGTTINHRGETRLDKMTMSLKDIRKMRKAK